MTDTETQDRLAALQRYVQDQTIQPLPTPPTAPVGSYASEAYSAQEYRRQLRIQAAAERAAEDQAQAELERPQRKRRQAEIDACVQELADEEARHLARIQELSAMRFKLIHTPLGRRVR